DDVVAGELVAQAVGESHERELAGGVGHEVRHADAPAYRRDVDDAPRALAAHDRQGGQRRVERPPEVRVHRVFVVGETHVIDGAHLDDAGVVDDDVNAPVAFERLQDGAFGLVAASYVGGDGEHVGKRLP